MKDFKQLLYERLMTETDLARKIGVSRQQVSLWVTEKRKPRPSTLEKIATILEIKPIELAKYFRS